MEDMVLLQTAGDQVAGEHLKKHLEESNVCKVFVPAGPTRGEKFWLFIWFNYNMLNCRGILLSVLIAQHHSKQYSESQKGGI